MTTSLTSILLLTILLLPPQVQAADHLPLSFADSLVAEGDHYRASTEYKRFLHLSPDASDQGMKPSTTDRD